MSDANTGTAPLRSFTNNRLLTIAILLASCFDGPGQMPNLLSPPIIGLADPAEKTVLSSCSSSKHTRPRAKSVEMDPGKRVSLLGLSTYIHFSATFYVFRCLLFCGVVTEWTSPDICPVRFCMRCDSELTCRIVVARVRVC